jgi:hypothetical protein
MSKEEHEINRSKQKPTWLSGHGGDTRAAHDANVKMIENYLDELRRTGRGLPANMLRPNKVSMQLVSKESGVKLISLTRMRSKCREIVEAAANDLDDARRIPVRVRMKDRVRPIYSIDEMISIASAVIQADCEASGEDHRAKCNRAAVLLRRVAHTSDKGLTHDCGDAIRSTLEKLNVSNDDRSLLSEIDGIRLNATRGELGLQTFHGRLKLEAALRGFGLGTLANFIAARPQTIVNWGSGLKSPTKMFYGDIKVIEELLGLPTDYLSEVRIDHRSGPSNVKHYHLPAEVRSMSLGHQKEFRRLVDPSINLSALPKGEREALMQKTLEIFHRSRDTDDVRRAKLRSEDMQYSLSELTPSLRAEFKQLTRQRQDVLLMGIVANKKRGWDQDTVNIYEKRFCLFFGWMHKVLGVQLDHLSIAYLAFPQILNEYMLHLVERKEMVGLEKGFSTIAREWYIFAASLTRGPLGGGLANFGDDDDDSDAGETVGWLRSRRELLNILAPIPVPRRRDELDVLRGVRDKVRHILTAKGIAKASSDWPGRLNETSNRYRSWRKEHEGNDTGSDSTGRVTAILALKNPLEPIEFGAFRLKQYIDSLPSDRARWATAVRSSVTMKFHAQLPLRRATFCALTYSDDNRGMVRWENNNWWVVIPQGVFKNERTKAFEKLLVDGFFRQKLLDHWGLYEDLATYVAIARQKVLAGVDSPAFYVAARNEGHVSPTTFSGEFRLLTRDYIAENPGTGDGWPGVRDFGSHAMRHIVATAVWKETKSLHAAAMAIHDSEKVTEKHYRKIVEGAEEHLENLSAIMTKAAIKYEWPKYGEILPQVSSPPSAPEAAPEAAFPLPLSGRG